MFTCDSQISSCVQVQVLCPLLVHPVVVTVLSSLDKVMVRRCSLSSFSRWCAVFSESASVIEVPVISSLYDRCTMVSLHCLCGNQQCSAFLSGGKRQAGVVVMLVQSVRESSCSFIRIFRLLCDIRASLAVSLLFLTYHCVTFHWLYENLFPTQLMSL